MNSIQDAVREMGDGALGIHEIVLVTRRNGDSHWRVRERFQLAKR